MAGQIFSTLGPGYRPIFCGVLAGIEAIFHRSFAIDPRSFAVRFTIWEASETRKRYSVGFTLTFEDAWSKGLLPIKRAI